MSDEGREKRRERSSHSSHHRSHRRKKEEKERSTHDDLKFNEARSIYVSNLATLVTEQDLKEFFGYCGTVDNLRILV